jgi:hypothetical protein
VCFSGLLGTTSRPPKWIKPQLTRLVDEAPTGDGWLHEIKCDGYRKHARIDGTQVKLLTRTGLDWVASLPAHGRGAATACADLSVSQEFGLLRHADFVAAPYLSPRARKLGAQQKNLGRVEDPK